MTSPVQPSLTFGVFHLFCGIGGGALGFQQAEDDYLGIHGRFRTLGGIDVDPAACTDFETLTGTRATCLDLFSRADYTAFHGHEPPEEWREATLADLRAAANGQRPDVVFSSPPCKGFSGLLPSAQAQSERYAALNRLTLRGLGLTLEAWRRDLPGLVIFENVPRITSRGAIFLTQIKALLTAYGYRVTEGSHDLGEVGGLAQHRRRYLLVARHPVKVPADLYHVPTKPVRSVGLVLETLPLPDDAAAGPMHHLPRLNWLTWVRLALIPAGGDWRDLQGIAPGQYAIEPDRTPFNHIYRTTGWDAPFGAVTSSSDQAITDPRLGHNPRKGVYRVARWEETTTTIIGAASVRGSNGVAAVADPRVSPKRGKTFNGSPGLMGVMDWESPSGAVTGSIHTTSGNAPASIADPRLGHAPREGSYKVGDWNDTASTITGGAGIGVSNGFQAVADPRLPQTHWDGHLSVMSWADPARTVTGNMTNFGSNAGSAIADPRLTCSPRSGAYRVVRWTDPAPTVTASGDVHSQGAAAVADPRLPGDRESGVWVIVAEDGTWHRPLTTLELAALQGFPTTLPNGEPLVLAGKNHSKWRERIGNAVPPPAAEAIGRAMLLALIPSQLGLWAWNVFGTAIWVHLSLWVRGMPFRITGIRARQ